jgi:hypothetical protein
MAITPVQIRDLSDSTSVGFQSFVDTSSTISVPYTTIVNRAPIQDLSNDLGVRFGVTRIMTQQIYQLQNEFGPNGEPVWAALNDDLGRVRFVGSGWAQGPMSSGQFYYTQNIGDYCEITFYGTGLNILSTNVAIARSSSVYLDGNFYGTFVQGTASTSPVLDARNYSANIVTNIVSTSLGLHTVKVQAAVSLLSIYGFEILNTASTLAVQPGSAYVGGNKLTLTSQQTPAYASGFTNVSGTAGTRGGRVLVYLASDGTIKKDVQYVDTAAAYLASASHANEEVVRTHFPREFGAGRTDDFNTVAPGGGAALAFTLDDGTTTLAGLNVGFAAEGISVSNNNGFLTITFVGTGLDVERFDDATSAGPETQYTYSIDGVSQGSFGSTGSTSKRIQKIVSGLPYGTHTFRFSRGTPTLFTPRFSKFIVYGPKKPTLPSGAVELADYNVMANYVANSTVDGSSAISQGVLTKMPAREMVYLGSWVQNSIDPTRWGGVRFQGNSGLASNDYVSYTFFGTGFEYEGYIGGTGVATYAVTLDGSPVTGTLYQSGTGATWTSGNISIAATSGNLRASYNGATLGIHTVKIVKTTVANNTDFGCFHVITPIHSAKSNLYADLQNTLTVGSCSLSDNRVYTPVKQSQVTKAWAQAVGVTSAPTTTSTSFVPCPDMSVTIKTGASLLDISYSIEGFNSNAGYFINFTVYLDGFAIGTVKAMQTSTTYDQTASDRILIPVSSGVHKVDLYWQVNGYTGTTTGTRRSLVVKES